MSQQQGPLTGSLPWTLFYEEEERIVGHAADGYYRIDVDESAPTPVEHQAFCPYKGLCNYYDTGLAALPYPDRRISGLASFEPGQTVIQHGPDRDLTVVEVLRPVNG